MKMNTIFLILLYFFFGSSMNLEHSNSVEYLEQELSECILSIINKYFDPNLPMVIQTSGAWDKEQSINFSPGNQLLKILSEQNNITHIILGHTSHEERSKMNRSAVKPGSYIYVVSSLNTEYEAMILNSMLSVRYLNIWNSVAYCIIVVVKSFSTEQEQKRLLPYFVTNAVFIGLSRIILISHVKSVKSVNEFIPNFDVITWQRNNEDPFCSQGWYEIRYLDTWISEERRFSLKSELFPIQRHMNNCVMRLSLYRHFPLVYNFRGGTHGVVINFLIKFCDLYKCRMEVKSPADMFFPMVYQEPASLYGIDITYPHLWKHLTWFVPAGKMVSRWMTIFRAFTSLMWLCVALTFISGTCVFWIIEKAKYWNNNNNSVSAGPNILITVLRTHLCVGDTCNYEGSEAAVFFSLWLFYCIIINTAYQAGLFKLMVNPGCLPPIQTEDQLRSSGLDMLTYIVVKGNDDSYWSKVTDYDPCTDLYKCYEIIADRKTLAILLDLEYGNIYKDFFKTELGAYKVIPLKEIVGTMFFGFQINTNIDSILKSRLNRLLARAKNTGLIQKWTSDILRLRSRKYFKKEVKEVIVFSLEHSQSAFWLILVGLLFAIFAFIVEILFYSWL
ncbi:Ionotropic receptor 424 [Blattella germanica]|nr:Ionotropic receptor 424 [Blattella germanica]